MRIRPFTYDKDYFAAWRKLEKLAAKSPLAQESPGTAKHQAEVLVKHIEMLGMRGRDQYTVRHLIHEDAEKLGLDVMIDPTNDVVVLRRRTTRHGATR